MKLNPYRILYVDDEPDLLEIGKVFLEQSGKLSITTTTNVFDAIELIEHEKFDAIISDFQMPAMNGIQFLIEVRKHFGSVPFILFTGKGREEVVIQAINNGVTFYLQKGGDPQAQFVELEHKIKIAVSQQKGDIERLKSNKRYYDYVNNAPNGVFIADETGRYLEVNPAACKITGYSMKELTAMGFVDLLPPESIDAATNHFKNVVEHGSAYGEMAFRHKDGSIRYWSVDAVKISPTCFMGFTSDITNRIKNENALKVSEIQKNAILNGIPINIVFVDKDLNILWVNNTAAKSVDMLPEEMVGHTCYSLWANPLKPCENCPTVKAFETKQSEYTIMHTPDGKIWNERGEPVFDENGNLMGVIEIAHDITDQGEPIKGS